MPFNIKHQTYIDSKCEEITPNTSRLRLAVIDENVLDYINRITPPKDQAYLLTAYRKYYFKQKQQRLSPDDIQ